MATFMQNFVRPSFYHADGTSDRLLVVTDPDHPQPFVATADIGAARPPSPTPSASTGWSWSSRARC